MHLEFSASQRSTLYGKQILTINTVWSARVVKGHQQT